MRHMRSLPQYRTERLSLDQLCMADLDAGLDHALSTLGLPKVVADILPANGASIRVAEKLGMWPVTTGPAR